jgi:hypothetical protein
VRLDASLKVFSLVFGLIYMACFFYTVAPVRYYPLQGRFFLEAQPDTAGPPILWYGWLLSAAVASAVLSVMLPPRLVARVWHGWFWVVPALTVVGIFIYERRYFQ